VPKFFSEHTVSLPEQLGIAAAVLYNVQNIFYFKIFSSF
jgi:hypothetical protein